MALRRRRHGRRGAPRARATEDVERRRRRVVGVGARKNERGPHARRDGRAGQPRRGPDPRGHVEDVQVAQELLRVDAAEDDDVRPDRRRGVARAAACVEINQCVGCTRQFFTKSFLGDDAADLARSSGEEPSLRADKELRRENAVVALLRYVYASDVYVRALLEDSFWSG